MCGPPARQGMKPGGSSRYLRAPSIWLSSVDGRFTRNPDLIYLRVKHEPLVFRELE